MRTTSALTTAALVIVAVVLGLGTVQGSLAVWNTATGTNAGKIQAADFAVTLQPGSGQPQRLPTNGAPAVIGLPDLGGLTPTDRVRTVPLTVTNATDAGNDNFRVRVTASADDQDAQDFSTTVEFPGSKECPAKGPSAVELKQGGCAILLVTVALKANAPATAGGKTSKVSVKLTATQLPDQR